MTWVSAWGSPVLVFVRSRGGPRALGVLVATVLAGALVPAQPVPVRVRLAAVGLGPIVAALPGVFLPTLLEHPEHQLEPSRVAWLALARAAWLGLLLIAFGEAGQIAFGGGPGALEVSARSLAFTAGLGLLTAQVVRAVAAWLPASILVMVTLVYGTASMSGRPYSWALLLYPAGSCAAGLTALGLLLCGSVLYVWRDSRSST